MKRFAICKTNHFDSVTFIAKTVEIDVYIIDLFKIVNNCMIVYRERPLYAEK